METNMNMNEQMNDKTHGGQHTLASAFNDPGVRAEKRRAFLASVSEALGRQAPPHRPAPRPVPADDPARTRFAGLDAAALASLFVENARGMLSNVEVVTPEGLAPKVLERVLAHGTKEKPASVVLTKDERLMAAGVVEQLEGAPELGPERVRVWDKADPAGSRAAAALASTGVVHADFGIADCGFVVLLNSGDRARSVPLLPLHSIVIVRKSTILPRVAQLGSLLHEKAAAGERMPACINLIGGPSTTADIELIKVVGVHGPVTSEVILVEGC